MKTKDMKRGISLIVLIITIIVVIILAAVVILTLSKNNPIESAKEARFKEDVRTFQDELALYISKQYSNAGGHWDGNISAKSYNEIVEYIPSFTKKYEGKFIINNNNLEYTNNLDEKEKEYAQNLNVKDSVKLLPDEYQQVEYIESTGTQYLNSKIIADVDLRYKVKCSHGYGGVFGVNNFDWREYGLFINGGLIYPMFNQTGYQLNTPENGINDISFDSQNNFYVNGSVNKNVFIQTINMKSDIFIFKMEDYYISNKLYLLNFYKEDRIMRNYIPCYAITKVINVDGNECEAGTKGLYDTVEGKFYTNQGDGDDFIAGPDVNE